MTSPGFDPFRDRQARDIRNSLSRSFLQALESRDFDLLNKSADAFQQHLRQPVYKSYINNRLNKYQKVFALVSSEKISDVLQQAEILWEHELYYEMHELVEQIWKTASGDRRKALQGLIQAAGMKIHLANNNLKGARGIGAKALVNLDKYGDRLGGFTRRKSVAAEVKTTLQALGVPALQDNYRPTGDSPDR